jgi:regulator of protease activity HflC (stomatin/prohibitin superfamily)
MSYDAESKKETRLIIKWSTIGGFLLFLIIIAGMIGCPRYDVYRQNLQGKAELARATQNRQIRIQESEAKRDAAIYEKQADSIRAVGINISNHIIGKSLKENEEYLKWLWITDVAGANVDKTIVYIPTETNIPILEAMRMNKQDVTVNIPSE